MRAFDHMLHSTDWLPSQVTSSQRLIFSFLSFLLLLFDFLCVDDVVILFCGPSNTSFSTELDWTFLNREEQKTFHVRETTLHL